MGAPVAESVTVPLTLPVTLGVGGGGGDDGGGVGDRCGGGAKLSVHAATKKTTPRHRIAEPIVLLSIAAVGQCM
jgi:hypothetical protein